MKDKITRALELRTVLDERLLKTIDDFIKDYSGEVFYSRSRIDSDIYDELSAIPRLECSLFVDLSIFKEER